jgi:ATP-dependent DNA helicase RecG
MTDDKQFKLPFESGFTRLLSVDDIYNSNSPDLFKILQEDRRIERKSAGVHAKALAEYIGMWANTAPNGGLIAVGLANDGKIEGTLGVGVEHINNLERTGDIHCPDARYETKRLVCTKNGKQDELILFRVSYNEKKLIKTSDGKVYVRRGGSKRELKGEELRELQIDKGEVAWEQEDSLLRYPDAFDAKAISDFVSAVVKTRNLSPDKTNEEVLVLRRLGRADETCFIPNRACALLFSSDPCRETPGCKIRFLRFDGKSEGVGEKFNAVKDVPLEGTVPSLIVQAERILNEQLREFSKLGRDGTFYTAPEYPKGAWYEAVVNACCHRSYSLKNSPIFVKMFDDRLEIESPGGFMPFITPDNIYEQHHPRNPQLMDALFYLAFVKCAHEGTRRMKQTMLDMLLPAPHFMQRETSFASVRVTLQNNIEHRKVWIDADASGVVGEILFKRLTAHEKRVINFVSEFGCISVSQAQKLTNLSWPTAKRMLEVLVSKHNILEHRKKQRVERDPGARYFLRDIPSDSESES